MAREAAVCRRAWALMRGRLAAAQACSEHNVATPEAWQPGDKVVVRPPTTAEEAEARTKAGYDYVDWYYCRKEL